MQRGLVGTWAYGSLAALAGAMALAWAAPVHAQRWGGWGGGRDRVTCQSQNDREQFCPAAIGGDAVQIFLGDPQSWKKPATLFPGGAEALKSAAEAAGVGIVVHSPYVINVASTNNRIRIPSRKLLQQTVTEAAAVGALGVVVHGGHVTAEKALKPAHRTIRVSERRAAPRTAPRPPGSAGRG